MIKTQMGRLFLVSRTHSQEGRKEHPPPKSLKEGPETLSPLTHPLPCPVPRDVSWKTEQCPHVCSPGTFLKGERIRVWGI